MAVPTRSGSVVPTTLGSLLLTMEEPVVPITPTDDAVILDAAVDAPAPALGCADGEAKSTELFRNLFEKLDLKRDGRIDADELVVGLHNMGYLHLSQAPIQSSHTALVD
jgi:hypothetical protein